MFVYVPDDGDLRSHVTSTSHGVGVGTAPLLPGSIGIAPYTPAEQRMREITEAIRAERETRHMRENIKAVDDWLLGKIDSEELKERIQ
jgi:hypothetical protein